MGIEILSGKIITKIVGAEVGNNQIVFSCSDGTAHRMFHWQDCCENVYIEDIIGDVHALIGAPVLMAEDVSNECDKEALDEYTESYTWTWYKLATIKGYVTIRWYGESNGYYSESVDFEEIKI